MFILAKGKMLRLVFLLFVTSPIFVFLSMFLKCSFLFCQALSLTVIMKWAGGSVYPIFTEYLGYEGSSYVYPAFAALVFALSSVFSLFSKVFAIRAIKKVEYKIVSKFSGSSYPLSVGDLKNVVKLLLHFVDIVVPALLLFFVSLAWMYVSVSAVAIVLTIIVFMIFLVRFGVRYSSKKYQYKRGKHKVEEYVSSEEHDSYLSVLLMSNYTTAVIVPVSAFLMVLGMVGVHYYSVELGEHANKLAALTAVALLQAKAFVGMTLKMGSCYKSLVAVDLVLFGDE